MIIIIPFILRKFHLVYYFTFYEQYSILFVLASSSDFMKIDSPFTKDGWFMTGDQVDVDGPGEGRQRVRAGFAMHLFGKCDASALDRAVQGPKGSDRELDGRLHAGFVSDIGCGEAGVDAELRCQSLAGGAIFLFGLVGLLFMPVLIAVVLTLGGGMLVWSGFVWTLFTYYGAPPEPPEPPETQPLEPGYPERREPRGNEASGRSGGS